MGTPEEKQTVIDSISASIAAILNYHAENELIRASFLGSEFNFTPLKSSISTIKEIAHKLEPIDLTTIPVDTLNIVNGTIGEILNNYFSIRNFKATDSNAINVRSQLIKVIDILAERLTLETSQIFILNFLNSDPTYFAAEAQDSLAEINSLKSQIEDAKRNIDNILESSKAATGKVGVNAYAKIFEDESGLHKTEAKKWLDYVIVISIVIVIAGFIFLKVMPTNQSTSYVIQFTITKIVILATFFYALSICMKNYRAHKHNEVLNKHRQNALSTFETFVNSSTDEQTKNAVLLQATMSIFANQQTGYSSSDNDGDMPSKVIEIIKSAAPTAKS